MSVWRKQRSITDQPARLRIGTEEHSGIVTNAHDGGASFVSALPLEADQDATLIVLHHRIPCRVMRSDEMGLGLAFKSKPASHVLATLCRRVR